MTKSIPIQEFCAETERILNEHATLIGILAGNLAVAYRALHEVAPSVAARYAEKFEAEVEHHGEYGWMHQMLANAARGIDEA